MKKWKETVSGDVQIGH